MLLSCNPLINPRQSLIPRMRGNRLGEPPNLRHRRAIRILLRSNPYILNLPGFPTESLHTKAPIPKFQTPKTQNPKSKSHNPKTKTSKFEFLRPTPET